MVIGLALIGYATDWCNESALSAGRKEGRKGKEAGGKERRGGDGRLGVKETFTIKRLTVETNAKKRRREKYELRRSVTHYLVQVCVPFGILE